MLQFLGTMPTVKPIIWTMLQQGVEKLGPAVQKFIEDPKRLSRIGDVIVWRGETGQQVVAALDSMGDQVDRIDGAVAGIESTQLSMAGTLAAVQAVSFATLGVASLSAGLMLLRFRSIEKRLTALSGKIDDIEGVIKAGQKAHLLNAIQFLELYETRNKDTDLDRSLQESKLATNTYGPLAADEAQGQKRLAVLNYRTRCYLLALTTEIRCLVCCEQPKAALDRIDGESQQLAVIATTVFQETLGKAPEIYLNPNLSSDGVTLELLAEAYQQAYHAKALDDQQQVRDAADLFERLRKPIFQSQRGLRRWFTPAGTAKDNCLARLRYLMACLEDTNRIRSLGLLIQQGLEGGFSLMDIEAQVKTWRAEKGPQDALVYAFA